MNSFPLKSFGCLETSNITFITPFTDPKRNNFPTSLIVRNLIASQDPCHTIFYFNRCLRKLIEWKDDHGEAIIEADVEGTMDESEFVEFIESLNNQKFKESDPISKQILLIFSFLPREKKQYIFNSSRILNAIGLLENETHWKVIFDCEPAACPMTSALPLNQIIPIGGSLRDNNIRLKDLVRNPDFDKFEFIKYIKLNDLNLTCLTNKTVHIIYDEYFFGTKLLEDLILIKHNSKVNKFIIYRDPDIDDQLFWNYYMERRGLNQMKITLTSLNKRFSQEGNDAENLWIIIYSDVRLAGYRCDLIPSNNLILIVTVNVENAMSALEDFEQHCGKRIQKKKFFNVNIYDDLKDYVEVISNALCF